MHIKGAQFCDTLTGFSIIKKIVARNSGKIPDTNYELFFQWGFLYVFLHHHVYFH
jgi:hypothetical protein